MGDDNLIDEQSNKDKLRSLCVGWGDVNLIDEQSNKDKLHSLCMGCG